MYHLYFKRCVRYATANGDITGGESGLGISKQIQYDNSRYFSVSIVPILAGNDPICRPVLAIHLAQVPRQHLRHLERREMPALVVHGLEHHLSEYARPPVDKDEDPYQL